MLWDLFQNNNIMITIIIIILEMIIISKDRTANPGPGSRH